MNLNFDALKEQSKIFTIRQAMIMKEGDWTPEEVFLTGYCRLNQLKNYYSTHNPVSQKALKAEIEALKAELAKR